MDKIRKKISSLLFLALNFLFATIYAQVGINTDTPNKLSELHITNRVDNEGNIIPKGIMIPRMTESERNKIDVNDELLANGLLIYNIDEDCYNYFSNTDTEWKSLCGKMGNAKISPINCSDIVVNGSYVEDIAVDASNYISINLNVEKPGILNLNIITDNGYSFSYSGTILETGPVTINVPAQGKPKAQGENKISISGIPLVDESCLPKIQVQSQVANYSINCASIEVKGEYMKNQSLNSSNVIVMTVNVTKEGSYSITTPSVNGMKFSASGVWSTTGVQAVTLIGQGVTNTFHGFPIDIQANTLSGNATCSAQIPVMLPPMTYGVIGNGYSYSWSSPERVSALNSSANFSPSGKFKIKSFSIKSGWSSATNINTTISLLKSKNFPDIILYNAFGLVPTAEFISLLSDYVNNGGVLIYGTADGFASYANLLLTGIFGSGYSGQATALPTDPGRAPYPVSNLVDDPIISGPFGNAAGQYWEEDNQGSVIVQSLPPNSIQIASASNIYTQPTLDPQQSIVWYNDSKNFVYFGDSVASAYDFSPANGGWPALYVRSQNWIPAPRYAGLTGRQVMCYNSILEFNSIAWGLKKAVDNGINPH